MEKMAENGRVTTHSVRSNAPIGRVSFESFMRFAPIGGEGSFLFARGTPLHFYDGGSKVTCKGPARALLASTRNRMEGGGTSLVSIFPDDTLTGHILQK